jgi:hypothetical protein
LLHIDELRA